MSRFDLELVLLVEVDNSSCAVAEAAAERRSIGSMATAIVSGGAAVAMIMVVVLLSPLQPQEMPRLSLAG